MTYDPKTSQICSVDPAPPKGPETMGEIKSYHDGYRAGLLAYAYAVGDSGLRAENQRLRELMDARGWKTIEAYEALSASQAEGAGDEGRDTGQRGADDVPPRRPAG